MWFRNYLKLVFLSVCLSVVCSKMALPQESDSPDKYTMLTMPYNKRPLSLYRGQFMASAGYKFAIRSQTFNKEGEKVYLKSTGTGSVFHYYLVNAEYGITNFLELGAETSLIRHGMRSQSVTYTAASLTSAERVTVNEFREVKGMGDLLLTATARLPLAYRWFDFSLTGGLYLPTARNEQEKPSHSVSDISTSNTVTVNYRFNYKYGFGVPVWLMAAGTKFSAGKYSVQAGLVYTTPREEGKGLRWDQTLENKTFVYGEKEYSYLLSDSWSGNLSLHYQATGWFDISLNGFYNKTNGGWTEYWGTRYRNPETGIFTVEPSFELQITPVLKVCQTAGFPVSGRNCDAPFYLFTTLRFSQFPFFR